MSERDKAIEMPDGWDGTPVIKLPVHYKNGFVIDADKQIVCNLLWNSHRVNYDARDQAGEYVANCINHAKQNAEAEKWIPVSERYPEEPQKCLITYTRSGDGRHLTRPSYWDGQRFERLRTPEYYGGVTAWMPLPKPYLEQAEGGEE